MQMITEKQIKNIAKQISQENKKIQYSRILEIISHSLGYKDYNSLYAKFKEEGNRVLAKLGSDALASPFDEAKTIVSDEFRKMSNKEILIERPTLDFVSAKLEDTAHTLGFSDYSAFKDYNISYYAQKNSHEEPKTKKKKITLVGKVCPNCKGEKGWEVGVETSPENTMWCSDGVCYELGYKECFYCSGTGRTTNKRIKEIKKMKRENLFLTK